MVRGLTPRFVINGWSQNFQLDQFCLTLIGQGFWILLECMGGGCEKPKKKKKSHKILYPKTAFFIEKSSTPHHWLVSIFSGVHPMAPQKFDFGPEKSKKYGFWAFCCRMCNVTKIRYRILFQVFIESGFNLTPVVFELSTPVGGGGFFQPSYKNLCRCHFDPMVGDQNTIEKFLKNWILDQKIRFLRTFCLNSDSR